MGVALHLDGQPYPEPGAVRAANAGETLPKPTRARKQIHDGNHTVRCMGRDHASDSSEPAAFIQDEKLHKADRLAGHVPVEVPLRRVLADRLVRQHDQRAIPSP